MYESFSEDELDAMGEESAFIRYLPLTSQMVAIITIIEAGIQDVGDFARVDDEEPLAVHLTLKPSEAVAVSVALQTLHILSPNLADVVFETFKKIARATTEIEKGLTDEYISELEARLDSPDWPSTVEDFLSRIETIEEE